MQNPPSANDQNLLFGMLAFQLDFVTQKQLIETMQAWMIDKTRSLGDVFVEKGLITPDRKTLLTSLVSEHIKDHENDPQKSLASMRLPESLRNPLQSLGDPQVSQIFSRVQAEQDPIQGEGILATVLPTTNERPPRDERRFVTVRPLDEGGLGIVTVAIDNELTREVALKEIKPQFADHTDSRARFLKEAEITGRLEHPGIVPVYGLGTYGDGRPYYAMRMIIGVSLKEAIKEFHEGQTAEPHEGKRVLALRELLQRFIDVCNAMEYAHSRGIVHRDIKPANIMLGKYRETLVVDWGLAKSVGETDQQISADETVIVPERGGESLPTRMGEVVGTIAFMSPEQAAGRVTEAGPLADVYSLGATLYNLLTGSVAFKDMSAGQLLSHVQQGKFPRPREVNRSVPAPLEAICLRAMARRPQDRYESAKALAVDLEHYLADEPVSAYREPISRRARRWMRKHPKSVTTAVTLVLGGLIGFGAVASVLNTKNQELELAKNRAEEAKDVAEEVKNLMTEAFSSADPERDGKKITVYEVLTRFTKENQVQDPRIAADLDQTIGKTLSGLGLYEDAVPFLERAHNLVVANSGAEHRNTLASMDLLSGAYSKAGQHEKAIPLLEDALQRTRDRLGEDHTDTQACMNNLAAVYQAAEKWDAALPLLEKTLELTRTKLGGSHEGTLASMNNLALGYQRANRLDDALSMARQTFEVARDTFGENSRFAFIAMKTLAVMYQATGQLDEAQELAERSLSLRQTMLGDDHPETLSAMNLLQDVQLNREEFAAAEDTVRTWLTLLDLMPRKDDEKIGRARTALAEALLGQGKTEEAASEARLAIKLLASVEPVPVDRLRAASVLGGALAEQEWNEAERLLVKSYERLRDRLSDIRPARRWSVPRAGQRIMEAYRVQGEPVQVSKWEAELERVNSQIERLRNAGSTADGS